MSAAEIVEMIERLPPNEQAEVYAWLDRKRAARGTREVKYIPQEEAERIAEKVFRDHEELFRKLAQ